MANSRWRTKRQVDDPQSGLHALVVAVIVPLSSAEEVRPRSRKRERVAVLAIFVSADVVVQEGLGNRIVTQIAEHCERFSGCPSGAYFCSLEVSIIQSFTSQFLDYCTFTALA